MNRLSPKISHGHMDVLYQTWLMSLFRQNPTSALAYAKTAPPVIPRGKR